MRTTFWIWWHLFSSLPRFLLPIGTKEVVRNVSFERIWNESGSATITIKINLLISDPVTISERFVDARKSKKLGMYFFCTNKECWRNINCIITVVFIQRVLKPDITSVYVLCRPIYMFLFDKYNLIIEQIFMLF